MTDAQQLVGLLADDTRRRVFAALVLGAVTVEEVQKATGLPARAASAAIAKLVDGELVVRGADGTLVVLGEAFRAAAIAGAPPRPADPVFPDGRLARIPAKRDKRLAVLDRLAQEFEPGVRYPEREVNARLRRFHDDYAALRRYLVDEGFLDRDGREYWRSGGST